MERALTVTTTAEISAEDAAANLEAAFEAFRAQHPGVVEAMAVMNMSFSDYLQALAAMQDVAITTDNNVAAA